MFEVGDIIGFRDKTLIFEVIAITSEEYNLYCIKDNDSKKSAVYWKNQYKNFSFKISESYFVLISSKKRERYKKLKKLYRTKR